MSAKLLEYIYCQDTNGIGDIVAVSKDGSEWLFPARVTKVIPCFYEEVHNNSFKFS